MFHRFSDETSFFVATMNQRPVGLETPFSIQLADRRPVLQGTCVVLAAWSTTDNPFKRPGVRLGIRRLTPESQNVFEKLKVARANNEGGTSLEPLSETPVAIPLPSATGTGAAPALSRPRPITNGLAMSRAATGTQRRVGSVMTPAMIPPKTPPEANVLEVILPLVADSPSEAIALPIEVEAERELRQDQRTPGSDYILPANPLMNLSDDSLNGFIDCTLYEDTSNFPNEPEMAQIVPAIPLLAGDEQVLVSRAGDQVVVTRTGTTMPPPMRRGNTIPPVFRLEQNVLREEPSMSMPMPTMRRSGSTIPPAIRLESSGILRVDSATGQSEPLRIETRSGHSGQLRLESSGLLRVEDDSGQSGLLRVDEASGKLHVEPIGRAAIGRDAITRAPMPPPLTTPAGQFAPITGHVPPQRFLQDVHTPVPAGEAFIAREHQRRLPPWMSRRVLIAGGAGAASLLVIVIIAIATRSSAKDERHAVAPPPTVPAPPPIAKPAPRATPATPATTPEPAGKEPDLDPAGEGPVVVGDGPCKLEVTTSPAGTMVSLDGRSIGPSPLTVAGTCDHHKVDLAHPRYKPEQKLVVLEAGKSATLDVTLVRPTHQMKILTSPSGAEVFIGGRRAGTSPTMVQINGFSGVDVRIERVGFKPTSKRVYSKLPDDKLFFSLDPLPRSK